MSKIHKGLNIAFRVHFFHYTASELIYRSVESTNCVSLCRVYIAIFNVKANLPVREEITHTVTMEAVLGLPVYCSHVVPLNFPKTLHQIKRYDHSEVNAWVGFFSDMRLTFVTTNGIFNSPPSQPTAWCSFVRRRPGSICGSITARTWLPVANAW